MKCAPGPSSAIQRHRLPLALSTLTCKRGLFRAETIAYPDLMAAGTMAEARKQGKLRLEGKEYIVADGDILNIRFNV